MLQTRMATVLSSPSRLALAGNANLLRRVQAAAISRRKVADAANLLPVEIILAGVIYCFHDQLELPLGATAGLPSSAPAPSGPNRHLGHTTRTPSRPPGPSSTRQVPRLASTSARQLKQTEPLIEQGQTTQPRPESIALKNLPGGLVRRDARGAWPDHTTAACGMRPTGLFHARHQQRAAPFARRFEFLGGLAVAGAAKGATHSPCGQIGCPCKHDH